MATISIQRRLISSIFVAQILLAVGLVDVAVFVTRSRLRDAFDTALRSRAMRVAALVRYSDAPGHPLVFVTGLAPTSLDPSAPDLYEVFVNEHTLLMRSNSWPDKQSVLPARSERWIASYVVNGFGYRAVRVANVPVLDRDDSKAVPDFLTVTYASPVEPVLRSVRQMLVYIVTGSVILLVISGGFLYWALRRSLRPLAELAASAAAVSPSNWELNPPEEARETEELAPLSRAMTSMLEGLRGAFTQQREFVANAAHELKTPVAILKSTLQSLAHRPRSSEEYRIGLEEALEDLQRLERLLHSMLRLARAEQWAAGNLQRNLPSVEVGMTCQVALERVQPVAQQRGVGLEFTAGRPLRVAADPDDLELVWSNLLENAIRFSPAGGKVTMTMRRKHGQGIVEVADDGPGIAPEDLPHVFDRFYRADSSRTRNTGGYGLGLAISKALIEAYGGTIEPHSLPGEGTRMVVSIPA